MVRRGFSLIELMVVLAMFMALVAILVPVLQMTREEASRAQCQNNLKQLGMAVGAYSAANKRLPAGYQELPRHAQGYRGNTVFASLLGHLEQDKRPGPWNLADPFLNVVDPKTGEGSAKTVSAAIIPTFICPADYVSQESPIFWKPSTKYWYDKVNVFGYYGPTSYLGNCGTQSYWVEDKSFKNDGALLYTSPRLHVQGEQKAVGPIRLDEITDGTGNTLLFGERYHYDANFDKMDSSIIKTPLCRWGAWGFVGGYRASGHVLGSSRAKLNYQVPLGANHQAAMDQRLNAWGSGHGRGANFCFVDGSVRFIADAVSHDVLQSLSTRSGAEAVPAEWRNP